MEDAEDKIRGSDWGHKIIGIYALSPLLPSLPLPKNQVKYFLRGERSISDFQILILLNFFGGGRIQIIWRMDAFGETDLGTKKSRRDNSWRTDERGVLGKEFTL